MTILAANSWRTNAELIADVAKLGYLRHEWLTLDPTYGRGTWWKVFRPERLVTCSDRLVTARDMIERRSDVEWPDPHYLEFDFRRMHFVDNHFDAVAFDPPYVCVGGRNTSGIPEMHERYGLTDAPTSPAELQELINDGLTECARVLNPNGYLLVKCQDYVSSGKLWIGTHHTLTHALSIGLECVDRFEHIGNPRPQPSGRRQVHARRNLSTLLVFRRLARKAQR